MKKIFSAMLIAAAVLLIQCRKNNCEENPKSNCGCIEIYEPVCGCNGKTYMNFCDAECNGITSYTKGACYEKKKP